MRNAATTTDRASPFPALVFTVLALTAIILSGCNTTAGLGEDIESAGSALEEEAEEASD